MSDLERQLEEHADQQAWSQVEDAWLGLSDQPPENVDVYRDIVESMVDLDQDRRLKDMVDIQVGAWRERDRVGDTFELMEPLVVNDLLPRDLYDAFIDALREQHDDHPAFDLCLELSQLSNKPANRASYEDFLSFLSFSPDQYVYHGSGWGTGKVQEVEETLETIVVDFDKKPGHRMDLEAARRYLTVIEEFDPRALAYESEELVREKMDETPARCVAAYLRSRGATVPLKELRDLFKDQFFSSSQWTSWWGSAKPKLMQHPKIKMTGQTAPDFSYRDDSVAPEDELMTKIQYAEDPQDVQKAIQNFSSYIEGNEELQDRIREELENKAEYFVSKAEEGKHRGAFIRMLLYLDRKTTLLPDELLEDVVPYILTLETDRKEQIRELSELLNDLQNTYELRKVLGLMEEAFEDELPHIEQELLLKVYGAAWKRVAEHVDRKGHQKFLEEALFQLTGVPGTFPLPYLSLIRYRNESFLEPVEEYVPTHQELFRSLIELAELDSDRYLPSDWTVRQFTKKVENVLLKNFDSIIERATQSLEADESLKFRNKIKRMHGFKDKTRAKLLSYLDDVKEETVQKGRFWESELIYSTQEGIEERQATYDEIVSEKMPENQRAIEEARAQGDVSENAELDAALEERSLLTSRARKLKKELELARNLADAPIQEDEVQPGTHVTLEDPASGEITEYTILGPWDANADENVISYQSPLADELLEAEAGETRTVSLPNGERTFRVKQIERTLDS